jgi:hypothetical protein
VKRRASTERRDERLCLFRQLRLETHAHWLDPTANTVLALATLDWENCGRKILLGAHSGRNFAKS